jgi:hypothetical protein
MSNGDLMVFQEACLHLLLNFIIRLDGQTMASQLWHHVQTATMKRRLYDQLPGSVGPQNQ